MVSVQPRIRLTRSFDQRYHSYLGYVLRVDGVVGGEEREFILAIGPKAQDKQEFRVGDVVSGESEPVLDERLEIAEFYKTSKLKVVDRSTYELGTPPPWRCVAPSLDEYRERGHRRLSARTYKTKCPECQWGCRMSVEMIIDQWNPSVREYRFETFCYGPKSCTFYRSGPTRKVPGRRGMVWEEEDWVDEEATAHRELNE